MHHLYPAPTVLLDATLRRDGEVRRWIVRSGDLGGWDCRVVVPGALTLCGYETLDLALARIREWQADIEVARADGWS